MERLFQKSVQRCGICLDGSWTITYDPEGKGEGLGYAQGENLSGHAIYIPSCWNFDLDRYGYEGAAWYCKKFHVGRPVHGRLTFHAVSGQAEVFLDGKRLGEHYGSYNRFSFDVPGLSSGEHCLVVKVDNAVNETDTLPLRFVDWFVYGGIYRSVELEFFDALSIDTIKIDTAWDACEIAQVRVEAVVKNWAAGDILDDFTLSVDGIRYETVNATIETGKAGVIEFVIDDFRPELWDLDSPRLYMFHLGCSYDDLFERTGFRKVETRGTGIFLNGREIYIKGINRHNDQPELGYAVNGPLILRDMQIIKELGCNSIRGSHYPNDPIVLDYCDELGFLFWEEIAFWNHPAESLGSSLLEKRARQMMRETIERDYNHPSIIFWSIQNESKSSSQEGLTLFSKIAADIREMDTSRLITFASACGRNDICFDLVDVVCWNMYPGWYDDAPIEGLAERYAESLRGHRQWLEENGQHKPFIISEFGGGAIPGEVTFEKWRRWTENYQEELLRQTLTALTTDNLVQGFYIWQYCDGRTAFMTKVSLGRPRNFNNKGLVDEHRKPKLAFNTVRRILSEVPTYRSK